MLLPPALWLLQRLPLAWPFYSRRCSLFRESPQEHQGDGQGRGTEHAPRPTQVLASEALASWERPRQPWGAGRLGPEWTCPQPQPAPHPHPSRMSSQAALPPPPLQSCELPREGRSPSQWSQNEVAPIRQGCPSLCKEPGPAQPNVCPPWVSLAWPS